MSRTTCRILLGSVLVLTCLVTVGCSKEPAKPKLDSADMSGTWVEKKVEGGRGRMQIVGEQWSRELLIGSDNTFVMTLKNDAGKTVDGQAKGTWAVEGTEITFTIEENTFKDKTQKSMAPATSDGVVEREFVNRGMVKQLAITDLEGGAAFFEKKD